MSTLAITYYLVAVFYALFAIGVLCFPHKVDHRLHSYFPLLKSFDPSPAVSTLCLASVGAILYIVGRQIADYSLYGLYFALVFSLWEVFLAFAFYLPRREYWNAAGHFVIHTVLAVLIVNLVVSGYLAQVGTIESQITGASFTAFFATYSVLTVFFVSLFAGEPGVLFLASLAAGGSISLGLIVVGAFTTALIGESFWFLLAQTRRADAWIEKLFRRHSPSLTIQTIERHIATHPFLLLLVGRFIAGASIVAIIYLGRKKLSYGTFFFYSCAVNALWAPIVVTIGYLAGSGFVYLLTTLKNIEFTLSIAVCGALIIGLGYTRLRRWVMILTAKRLNRIDQSHN